LAHPQDGGDSLLVDVSRLLEERLPDEVVRQSAPEVTRLVGKGAEPRADDGLHTQALDLGRVFGHLSRSVWGQVGSKMFFLTAAPSG